MPAIATRPPQKRGTVPSAALVMFFTAVERLLNDAENLREAQTKLLSESTDAATAAAESEVSR